MGQNDKIAPVEEFTLPCGILKDGKVYRKATLAPFTGAVMKDIGKRDVRERHARMFSVALGHCLVGVEGVDPLTQAVLNGMLVADRDFCVFKAREITLGPMVTRTLRCPNRKCRVKLDFELDLRDLSFKELRPEDYEIVGDERVFTVKAPPGAKEAWAAKFRYPQGTDQGVIADMVEENPVEAEQHTAWRCLVEWCGDKGPFPKNFMETLHLGTLNDVLAQFKAAMPGMDDLPPRQCPACGIDVAVEFGPDFLYRTTAAKKTS